MTTVPISCPWTERASALVDGELPSEEHDLVVRHVRTCATCSALAATDSLVGRPSPASESFATGLHLRSPRVRVPIRAGLALAGAAITVSSVPDFLRSSTVGASLHDLRHLAIWQAAIGVAVVAAAATFRLSRLVLVLTVTFLALTACAAAYDAVTGHPGPWSDPTHVLEVVAAVLLLVVAWPYVRLGHATRS